MSHDKFAVVRQGQVVTYLNPALVERQGLTDLQVEKLKQLHVIRLDLEDSYKANEISAEEYRTGWTQVQFDLQEAWGFPKNQDYHRFWDMPGCKCPRMDNSDKWPAGYYTYSGGCPVHQELFKSN